ncbi:hypothetical protein [uncultured Adlercreutzia sp.]|nr:hypothetical protein [uncultured Adlercreutzia sp.]
MKAIEADAFDHKAYRAFTTKNVALPAEGTCTETVCEKILSLAQANA